MVSHSYDTTPDLSINLGVKPPSGGGSPLFGFCGITGSGWSTNDNERLDKKIRWILKSEWKKLLNNIGKVSHEQAIKKANTKFIKYKKEQDKNYISDFDRAVKKLLQVKKKKIKK